MTVAVPDNNTLMNQKLIGLLKSYPGKNLVELYEKGELPPEDAADIVFIQRVLRS